MRKLLNKPWLVALLALGALGAIVDALRRSDAPSSSRQAAAADPAAFDDGSEDEVEVTAPAARGGRLVSIADALAALVMPAELRDPFTRLGPTLVAGDVEAARPAEMEQVESVHLSGIWSQEDVDLVLINDRIQLVGDTIGRITVQAIGLEGVWVTHWKGRNFVPLGGTFTLTTTVREGDAALALHAR